MLFIFSKLELKNSNKIFIILVNLFLSSLVSLLYSSSLVSKLS
ncbi:hypothetical protein BGAFAR04_F0014 (plasmid) [Borreliella garinii Far04]|nr:hypothetical protein BGAFAR04_F0014 [Borreliella garinii Far04]